MNDPNKKIQVNLSSLLSFKAELLRKQAEVSKVKATRSKETFVPSKAKTYKKDEINEVSNGGKDKDTKVYEFEDSTLLEKSQKVLEAKSKYYDRMTKLGGKLNSDDNCLVLFNRKKQEESISEPVRDNYSSSDTASESESEEPDVGPVHPDDEWVEYTDCLGRTRKCLRKDLEFIKKKDSKLAASIPDRLDQTKPNWMLDVNPSATESSRPPESLVGDGASTMSKHDEMRNNWEKKEVENLTKENVHYQDVFFDEARQHGVGYYAFSTDDEERARQQKQLEEIRQKTLEEQAQREALRRSRDKIIAERVRAAKNRQRARLGLPPLEEEAEENDKSKEDDSQPPDTKEERKRRKREEKLKRKKEREEQLREEERKSYVRPWDKDKNNGRQSPKNSETDDNEPEDEPWSYKPDRNPMSQEQWNEKKRLERNPEFAPVSESTTHRERKRRMDSDQYESTEKLSRTNFRSSDTTSYSMMPPPSVLTSHEPQKNFAPFQSTKKAREFQRRNYNACATGSNDDMDTRHRGAEIAPPSGLDPEPFLRPKQTHESLENSIEAGLKFLRNNFDKSTMSTKSSWTAKSDY